MTHNKPLYMLLRCQYLTFFLQFINLKKNFCFSYMFYSYKNCKWFEWKIQREAYITHMAQNVLNEENFYYLYHIT